MENLQRQQRFNIDQNSWQFTLPDLYTFLRQEATFSSIEYKQFRQLIFNSPINKSIKLHGAEIIIKENLHKVDRSTYALVWQDDK